jgi:transcriptional regulator with XRE-family HTH domain
MIKAKAMQPRKNHHAQDLHIAKKLRERRIELGLSQTELAASIGISPQQVHKYEKNIDRISASRLYEFSQLLSVPVSFFHKKEEGDDSIIAEKGQVIRGAILQGKKVKLKFFKLKAIMTDIKTNEIYEVDIS